MMSVRDETVKRKGYVLRVYDRERTLCEFFRMRLQIGKDTALEVFKQYMAGKKNLQKLYEYADTPRIKRYWNPMWRLPCEQGGKY
jgi:hypothetical protein